MSLKLWNFYDSIDIENLISRNNLNKVKLVLYSLDEGYEVFLKINDKEESMFFTYQDTRVLDSLDYGLLPTAILSGICQAKEQYLYSNCVIVEVFDRRNSSTTDLSCQDQLERRHITVLRITDNSIMKLTGIKSRLGDLREEQQWLSRKSARLDLNVTSSPDTEDGLGFIGAEWFQALARKQHVSSVLRRKRQAHWDSNEDGPFRPGRLTDIGHWRLKTHLQTGLLAPTTTTRSSDDDGLRHERPRVEIGDEMLEKIRKLLEYQKQSIFKSNPPLIIKYNDCHEECVHQMIIRSPLSGSNFKLILSRCPLHNRHWGHLVVDQWEGSSTKPIRFELPGGYGQGRRLLNQLSEMLGARISVNTELGSAVTDSSSVLDQNISPKQPDTSAGLKCIANDTIWESIESIMTKNIQSGKPLYDNRDHSNSSIVMTANDGDNLCKKKKSSLSNPSSKSKLSTANLSTETAYQISSKKNALLKVGSMSGELQQKQSLYSLKDLNLDDLF